MSDLMLYLSAAYLGAGVADGGPFGQVFAAASVVLLASAVAWTWLES